MPDQPRQTPVFDVRQFVPQPYADDSFFALIEQSAHLIIREADFPPPAGPGQRPHDPVMLSKLVLLMTRFGWTEREAARRTEFDLQVKACLGLGIDERGPSQPTIHRHRDRMKSLGLDTLYLDRLTKLLRRLDLIQRDEGLMADSTPVAGAGQVLDTFNLLAAGIRRGLRALAKVRGMSSVELASELGLERYLARSVKGSFDADWTQPAERCAVLETLVEDAERLREAAAEGITESRDEPDDEPDGPAPMANTPSDASPRRPRARGKPKARAELRIALALIADTLACDVQRDAKGRVTGVRQRAAGGRPISATDPDMRHGRKSASVLIAGYKAHLLASTRHDFIVEVAVTAANVHDHQPLARLVTGARRRGQRPPWVAADRAYGTLRNHTDFAADGRTELVAHVIRSTNGGRFTVDDFTIDLDARTAACPRGEVTDGRWARRQDLRGWSFTFAADACDGCPLRPQCTRAGEGKGRNLFVVPETHRLVQARLARQGEPEFVERMRWRPGIERVIAGFAQCGGKQAQRFGLEDVTFDARLSALAYNLRRLAALAASDAALRARLEALLRLVLVILVSWLRARLSRSVVPGGRCR